MTASSSTRLLAFNPSTFDFDYLTRDNDGNLRVAVSGGTGGNNVMVMGSYSGAPVELECTDAGKLSTVAHGYDSVNGAYRAIDCSETGEASVVVKNSSLDVHCFGANGTNSYALKTDTDGQLLVKSALQTAAGDAISTSPADGSKLSLDVRMFAHDAANDIVKEVRMGEGYGVWIENATGTQLDVKSSSAVPVFARGLATSTTQVATAATVVGPQQLGTVAVDTDGYIWIGAFISCPLGVTSGGQIHVQYSADNNIWAQSSDSVYIMSAGAATSGLIRLSSPVPFRYVRLWADSSFNASGVNAFVSMK